MQSRPIVSSTLSMTHHTSVYSDKLLQPVLKKLITVCTSTQQLILDTEDLKWNRNSFMLCRWLRLLIVLGDLCMYVVRCTYSPNKCIIYAISVTHICILN